MRHKFPHDGEGMTWFEAYRDRDIEAFHQFLFLECSRDELQALFTQVCEDVPKITLNDGPDVRTVPIEPVEDGEELPNEFREAWNAATAWEQHLAWILYEGFLEAAAMGDPVDPSLAWPDFKTEVEQSLQCFASEGESCGGTPSKANFAREALDALTHIDQLTELMCREIDPNQDKPEDRAWLIRVINEAAYAGFDAGRFANAAELKARDPLIVRGQANIRWSDGGGKASAEQSAARRRPILQHMESRVAAGMGISAAAKNAHRRGLGTSAEANRRLYYNHRK